jgi:hypothetical protein
LALQAFGLASYKLRGGFWTSHLEWHQASLLQTSANMHLKFLGVQHPDIPVFTTYLLTTCHYNKAKKQLGKLSWLARELKPYRKLFGDRLHVLVVSGSL